MTEEESSFEIVQYTDAQIKGHAEMPEYKIQ